MGLDKRKRLAQVKAAAAAELRKKTARLDPRFPFKIIAFNAALFDVPGSGPDLPRVDS